MSRATVGAVSAAHRLPAISRWPLVGNLPEFRRDRVALFQRVRRECGDLGAFHLGPRPLVVVSSPELAHAVLVGQADAFEKGPTLTRLARPVIGAGLLSLPTAAHRARRRLVQPAFVAREVAAHLSSMASDASAALDRWPDGARIDLADEMMRLTLRLIGRALFSVDLADAAPELRHALEVLQRWVSGLLERLVPLPLWLPTPDNLRARRAIARLDAMIFGMVKERRAHATPHRDLLSLLVSSRADDGSGGLDDRQIRDEAMTLFVAGHETTAFALTWTLHLIAQHPHVQDRLAAEVDRVLGDRAPTADDLPRLPYTLQVLKEGLRLYPPGHTIGRVARKGLRLGDHAIPAGTIVLVSPLLLHRRADLFAQPDAFDPDRFAPEAEARLTRHAYLPFGLGARGCVGNHFALAESQLVLALIARRIRLSPDCTTHPQPEMMVTLRPSGPVLARITRRRP